MQSNRPDAPDRPKSRRIAAVSVLALLAALVGAAAAAESAAPIAAAELARRIEAGSAPLVLDVRTPKEFAAGHIPGAVNIPYDQLAGRLEELPGKRDTEIVVHCYSGKRAAVAEGVLRDAGYTRVRDLEGHWLGWSQAGLPRAQ